MKLLVVVMLSLGLALMFLGINPTQGNEEPQAEARECGYISGRVDFVGEQRVPSAMAAVMYGASGSPQRLISFTYFAIHSIIPQRILTWIAGRLPYDDDAYVPAGFFVTPPELPCECNANSSIVPPLSKLVLVPRSLILGTVVAVEPMYDPRKDDWNHQTYYLKPDNRSFLNEYSDRVHLSWPGTDGTIKCEPPVTDTRLPHVGDRIVVLGAFCIDLAHGWTSIIPLAWVLAPHRNDANPSHNVARTFRADGRMSAAMSADRKTLY